MNNQSPPQYEEFSPDDQPPPYSDRPLTKEERQQIYNEESEISLQEALRRNKETRRAQNANPFNPLTTVLGLIAEKTPLSLVSAALIIGGTLFE